RQVPRRRSRRGQGRGRARPGWNRHRAPRRGRRHGQGDRAERQRREGAPDAPQGHGRPRRRADLARDPLREPVSEPAAATDDRLVVALVRGVHGLRGAVRVEILTDRPEERFVPGAVLHREGADGPLTIATAEAVVDGPGWRIRFQEIATRDAADTLRGAYLEATVRPDEDLARGSYYWHEVIGTAVRGIDGAELGTVSDIYRVGETEVFVVDGGA